MTRTTHHILSLVIGALLSAPGLAAEKPALWEHAGLAAATEAAASDDALVLVVFTAEWCGPCKTLKRQTLSTEPFAAGAAPLHMTYVDIDSEPETARRFGVGAIPHLVLMTAQSQIVASQTGGRATADLLAWIAEGRERAARGQWQGQAAGAGPIQPPASADDFAKLIALLGDADPGVRTTAGEALRATREAAMPHLLQALRADYLGTRVGAVELLRRLAPDAPAFDPWSPADTRTGQLASLTKWWAATNVLPAIGEQRALDPAELRTIDGALDAAVGDDPVRRTQGMATLIGFGESALPRVRETIDARARAGDQKAVWVLEDVRWAILVPDALESRVSVRRHLSRGTSERRQDAAIRLADAGADSLAALRELVRDFDPLVREQAAGALTKVAGPAALDALAVLLESSDANLRMVAAQALGATKDADAGKHLIKALQDPDEVVAAVAIGAMEQIKAGDSEQIDALIACLADKRWRVRAASAEALGKLRAKQAAGPIAALLDDTDAFVVRTAVTALRSLQAAPEPERLAALAERSPDLVAVAVGAMIESDTAATLAAVASLYEKTSEQGRLELLSSLARTSNYRNSDDSHWKAVLDKAAASEEPAVRLKLADVLSGRSVALSRAYVGAMLEDADPSVAAAAVGQVVRIAAWHWGVTEDKPAGDFGILAGRSPSQNRAAGGEPGLTAEHVKVIIESNPEHAAEILEALGDRAPGELRPFEEGAAEELPHVAKRRVAKEHAAWHATIGKRLAERPAPAFAVAYYVTGDGDSGIDALTRALSEAPPDELFKGVDATHACALILKRLPWPAGQPVVVAAADRPHAHAAMLTALPHAAAEARAYLVAPELIVRQIVTADEKSFASLAGQLLSGRNEGGLDLCVATDDTRSIVARLLGSDSGRARAVGVYAIGHHHGAEAIERAAAAVHDPDDAVRIVAVNAVAVRISDPLQREQMLGALVEADNPAVVIAAAAALVDTPSRDALGILDPQRQFTYGTATIYRYTSVRFSSSGGDAERPPAVIDRKPEFLSTARDRLAATGDAKPSPELHLALALLLAQYGDFDALQVLADRAAAKPDDPRAQALVSLALKLTRDPRYLAGIAAQIKTADAWELRGLLGSLRGLSGPEVRDLRRQINERMRETDRY